MAFMAAGAAVSKFRNRGRGGSYEGAGHFGRNRKRYASAAIGSALVLGVAARCEGAVGVDKYAHVAKAGKGTLELAYRTKLNECFGESVTNVKAVEAAYHIDAHAKFLGHKITSPHLFSWSEDYNGHVTAKLCNTKSATRAAVYNKTGVNAGKYVVTILKGDINAIAYDTNPMEKVFHDSHSLTAAVAGNAVSDVKGIPGMEKLADVVPGVNVNSVTDIQTYLQGIDRLEAYRVATGKCGPMALTALTNPNDPDSYVSEIKSELVLEAHALDNKSGITANDIAVVFPTVTEIPDEYQALTDQINAGASSHHTHIHFPAYSKMAACTLGTTFSTTAPTAPPVPGSH